jgi:hypothetical protein
MLLELSATEIISGRKQYHLFEQFERLSRKLALARTGSYVISFRHRFWRQFRPPVPASS